MADKGDKNKSEISGPIRLIVIVFGLILLVAGSIGTFKHNNAVGFTTLIVVGSFAFLIAGAGRWPNKIGFGGGSMDIPEAMSVLTGAVGTAVKNPKATKEEIETLKKAHSDFMVAMNKTFE